MKLISTLIIIFIITGCTSMRSVELSPEQLQARISAGELINEGDKVKIVTTEGITHQFVVTDINDATIVGDNIEVPIVDIIALRTKEFSGGKTAGLAGGTVVLILLLASTITLGVGY